MDTTTSATIPRFMPDTDPATLAEALRTRGVIVIERLASPELCDRLAAELGPWVVTTPTGADDFSGRATRRTGGLLTKAPSSADLVAHPLVLDVVERTLWDRSTTFQLHLTQSIAIGPGSALQMLHRDHWCFDMFPFPRDIHVEVSTIWALTDFTDANGATRVVPDSHTTPDEQRYTHDDTAPAEMPRGSIVMYLGSTVHGGGANTTDDVRIGINVDYVLGFLRQEENQYLTYSLDEVRAMPERIQRLLGYQPGAYALGYIDGGRSPMTLLSSDHATDGQSFAVS
jgi:ectoine hydroxylase-related dioxygenase (phytanoyl-CoA dioxygenase family)